MTRSEMISYTVQWLSVQLSKARIRVNHEMCARCSDYSLERCARCWEETAWAATERERRRREEIDGR